MKTACFSSSKPPTKEELVLENAGVGDRKLALKLDRLDRESKAHMKMREREEKSMRQIGSDIRKHRVFDDSSVGRKVDSSGRGNRLLPPISTPENSPHNIRRVRSTPGSPINNRKDCSSASPYRTSSSLSSAALDVPDSDKDRTGLRVRSAGPGLSPAVLHTRSRSTSNLPSAAGTLPAGHGTPAAVYTHKEGKKQHSNSDLSGMSILTPHSPTTPNTTKQRPWERGLTPARRARSPAELAKVQGSLSYLTPSAHNQIYLRPSKSESNLSGVVKCSEDPRFQKLASCLVRNDDTYTVSSSGESQADRNCARSSSTEALNQEMVAIRITSSTPTLPQSQKELKNPVPPLPGHLKEPGGSLPPLKAQHPRTLSSPRILINTTVSQADRLGEVVSEETVELNRFRLGCGSGGGGGTASKELIILDTGRLKPTNLEVDIQSPPFYSKTHIPDW